MRQANLDGTVDEIYYRVVYTRYIGASLGYGAMKFSFQEAERQAHRLAAEGRLIKHIEKVTCKSKPVAYLSVRRVSDEKGE